MREGLLTLGSRQNRVYHVGFATGQGTPSRCNNPWGNSPLKRTRTNAFSSQEYLPQMEADGGCCDTFFCVEP